MTFSTRDNFLSLVRRQGYQTVPHSFVLCPSLEETYRRRTGSDLWYPDYFRMPLRDAPSVPVLPTPRDTAETYYPDGLRSGTYVDWFGVAHEPGSAAAMHMTRMRHPLERVGTLHELTEYPFPIVQESKEAIEEHTRMNAKIRAEDKIVCGNMQCSVWESAWYLRGMENLMVDMMNASPLAQYLLDRITDFSVKRAEHFAKTGVDVIYLGDDIGMQHSVMMSETLYCDWLKPRLKKIIDAIRAINPGIVVFYHSCGYVTPFIPHLIEAGIDVLNPVQPECMDFAEIHKAFGDRLSFCGAIGTQTTMPFGTPDDVRRAVFQCLDTAGNKGGLLVEPTHMLEPEVPWENIEAYVKACEDYTR